MDLFEAYKTDRATEFEGVWVPFSNVGVKVKLARTTGKFWEVERERALRPLRRRYRDDAIPDSEIFAALREPFCSLIIKDWEGVEEKGKALPCSMENRLRICTELPDFFVELFLEAGRIENYRKVEDEEDAKKSLAS